MIKLIASILYVILDITIILIVNSVAILWNGKMVKDCIEVSPEHNIFMDKYNYERQTFPNVFVWFVYRLKN